MNAALSLRPVWGIRSYLAILVLAVALPAGGLIAYGIYDAEREAAALANAHVRAIADEIAGDIELIVRESEALIGRIAARPLVRALDPKRCDPAVREFVDLNPRYVTLAVRDSLGKPVCTYHADPYPAERVAAFPWFQEGLRSGGSSISGAFFRPRPGRWVSTLTAPVRDESGRVAGLIVLPLDLLHLQQQVMHSLPKQAMASVLDRDGFFLMRALEPEKWIGKQGRLPSLPEAFWREREGHARIAGIDRVTRLYAFSTVPSTGWRVFAGLPEDIVVAAQRARAVRGAVIGLLVVLLATGAALGISRAIVVPMRRLASTAHAVAGGELAARAQETGAAEVASVAREFNRMLDARETMETALRESEARYRQFVERSPDPMYAHAGGRIVLANAAMEELLGAKPGSLLGMPVLDTVAPADRELLSTRIARVLQDLPVPRAELRYLRLDGSTVPIESAASPIRLSGEPAALVTARDITERKRAEHEIRETRRRLETLIANLPGVAYRCRNDPSWTTEFVSAGMLSLSGHAPEEFMSHRIELGDFIHPEDRDRVWETVQQAIASKGPYEIEYRIRTASGEVKWVWDHGRGVYEDDNLVALEGFVADITERTNAEAASREQLAELQRWFDATVGREEKMMELKREVDELLVRLGQPQRYSGEADSRSQGPG